MNYDEFGRPIYETAGEYNKAHKTRKKLFSSVNLNVASYQKNEKKISNGDKGLILVFASITFILCFVIVLTSFFGNNVTENEWYDSDEISDSGEIFGDTNTPLPEGFDTFSLNGESITLPITYENLFRKGFYVTEYVGRDVFCAESSETIELYDIDGNYIADIAVVNQTNEDITFRKCSIDWICIDKDMLDDEEEILSDFIFGNGLTFDSSYKELCDYLGEPSYHYYDYYEDGDRFDAYEWSYETSDELSYIKVDFWNDRISMVKIRKS